MKILDNRIRNAFNSVHAEDELKNNTKEFLAEYAVKANKTSAQRFKRTVVAFAACFILTLLGIGGWRFYTIPVSAISVDVNPSIELGINRFDRVVTVDTYNKEGELLVKSVRLKNLNYSNAIETLLNSEAMKPYVSTDDNLVSITVIGDTKQKSEEMQNKIRSRKYGESTNIECHASNREQTKAAHDAGLSFGKYRAYLELKALDPEIKPDEIKNLSMRQIRDQISALKNNCDPTSDENCCGALEEPTAKQHHGKHSSHS